MKVLWLCAFSNSKIRQILNLSENKFENLIRKLFKLPKVNYTDFAQWITNSIIEFEKFDDTELHILSSHYGMNKKKISFQLNGVNYHFYKPDDNNLIKSIRKISKIFNSKYKRNRKYANEFIELINPDIIHLFGAENPYSSITALDINTNKYPLIITLQTLLSDPEFETKQKSHINLYRFRSEVEKNVLRMTIYICSSVQKYRELIWKNINPYAIFFKSYLLITNKLTVYNTEKKYDFVYFASMINKAADYAIEAFAIAQKKYPDITLNILGAMPHPFTKNLANRIVELGIEKNVFFSGRLKTHQDVIKQIQFAKYALLPLKIDIISSTIREAMAVGLPVITTITPGTPTLNEKRQCVLLSEQGDFQSMANNMLKLMETPNLANQLIENSKVTISERWNNEKDMKELALVYKAVITYHQNGELIPDDLMTINPLLKSE